MKDIPLFKVAMNESAVQRAAEVMRSGYIGQGKVTEEFESVIQDYLHSRYVACTNSATSAEHIALHLLKSNPALMDMNAQIAPHAWTWEPGDEVLATPLTCTATNWPAITQGLKLKWVDIDKRTLNMDLEDLARKITPSTKVIFPVLWGGMPLDMDEMVRVRQKAHDIVGFYPAVIYDCAHAIGSLYKGKPVSAYDGSSFYTYSFQAIKHLTAIEGGALVCPNEYLWKRAKLLRWYGLDRETPAKDFRCGQRVTEAGFKMNMVDVNAAVGLENFKTLGDILNGHRRIAAYYDEHLKNVNGIDLIGRTPDAESSWWVYTVLVQDRNNFTNALKNAGIATSRVHERNDIYPLTKSYKAILPNLDWASNLMICIPCGWWMEEEDAARVVDVIKKGW